MYYSKNAKNKAIAFKVVVITAVLSFGCFGTGSYAW